MRGCCRMPAKMRSGLGDVPLALSNDSPTRLRSSAARSTQSEGETHLRVGPFPLAMGGSSPALAEGSISASGYRFSLRGDTDVKNLYLLSSTLGVQGFRPVAEGTARVDVNVSGAWQGFLAPELQGTAQLHNVRTGMRGLNPTIDIASAMIRLSPESVSVEKLSAQTDDTHWTGTVKAPRHCPPTGCAFAFDLSADRLSSSDLSEWFTPRPVKRPWYQILSSTEPSGVSPLLALQAHGPLHINRLILKKVEGSQISTQVELDRGRITLDQLRGRIFDGDHRGNWVIDASVQPPHMQVKGAVAKCFAGKNERGR